MKRPSAVLLLLALLALLASAFVFFWASRGGGPPRAEAVSPEEVSQRSPEPVAGRTPASTAFAGRSAAPEARLDGGGAPPAAPPAAEPESAALAEFDGREWQEVQRKVPDGSVEVVVLRNKQPLGDVRVALHRQAGRSTVDVDAHEPPIEEQRTDEAGRVLFRDVPPIALVVAAYDGERRIVARAEPTANRTNRTIVLLFGSASVEGTVRDPAGQLLRGATVWVHGVGPMPSRSATTRTADDGSYRFEGLCRGRYHVTVEVPDDRSRGWERMVTLDPGERALVDFHPLARRGSVRGRIVDGAGGTVFGERLLRFVHEEHDDEHRVRTAGDGTFAVELPFGKWSVAPWQLAGGSGAPLATADVGTTPADVAVRWPGLRLVVALQHAGALQPQQLRGGLTLRRPERGWLQPDAAEVVDGVACVQWLELEPGEYTLEAGNEVRLEGHARGLTVRLDAARPVEHLTLPIVARPSRR